MTAEEEIPLAPCAGWETGIVAAYGIGIMRIRYVVSPMERGDSDFHMSPTYALTSDQLRELGQKMLSLAEALEQPTAPDPSVPRN